MKNYMVGLTFLCLTATLALAGSWGTGGCFAAPMTPVGVQAPVYEWRALTGRVDQVALYDHGVQVGGYNFTMKIFRPLALDGTWGPVTSCPVTPPSQPADLCHCDKSRGCDCPGGCKCVKVEYPTGVVPSKITHNYSSVNGQECTHQDVKNAVAAGVVDDSAKCRLTVIDPNNQRRSRIMAEIQANPDSTKFLIQEYNPTVHDEAWPLDVGFKVSDTTTIYCQAPDGRVIWREDGYNPDNIKLGLRKTDPTYDPTKDPDLHQHPAPLPVPSPLDPTPAPPVESTLMPWCCVAAAIIVALYLKRQKENTPV